MKVRAKFAWLLMMVGLLALTYVGLVYQAGPRSPSSREPIRLALARLDAALLAWVALSQGTLEAEGLAVEVLPQADGLSSGKALVEGRVEIAAVAHSVVVRDLMTTGKMRIFGTIHSSTSNIKVVTRRDRNIASVADLKGKRVGVTGMNAGYFYLNSELLYSGAGFQVDNLNINDLTPYALIDQLVDGRLDAIVVREPFLSLARRRLGSDGVVLGRSDLYTTTYNVVCLEDLIRNRPQVLRKFLRGLVRAEILLRREPQKVVKALEEEILLSEELRGSRGDLSAFALRLDEHLLMAMEEESRWLLHRAVGGGTALNFMRAVHLDALLEVKSEAVGIVH